MEALEWYTLICGIIWLAILLIDLIEYDYDDIWKIAGYFFRMLIVLACFFVVGVSLGQKSAYKKAAYGNNPYKIEVVMDTIIVKQ